jgi:hypothetical protein
MRIPIVAAILVMMPTLAFAGGEPLGSSSGGSLYTPQYSTLGKAIGNRVTTIRPRGTMAPAGTLGSESEDPARSEREENQQLLERHLDCFSGPVAPDRDVRNSFQSRCPGNNR